MSLVAEQIIPGRGEPFGAEEGLNGPLELEIAQAPVGPVGLFLAVEREQKTVREPLVMLIPRTATLAPKARS